MEASREVGKPGRGGALTKSKNKIARALDRVSSEPTQKGCLLWEGAVNNRGGYGQVRLGEKDVRTHRVAWAFGLSGQRHGALPPPHVVIRHKCDNPRCNNPEHLQAGTSADNNRDTVERGRIRPPRGEANGSRKHPESRPRGEANGNATLSDAAVARVRELREEGLLLREIAERVGCSQSHVSDILRGRKRVPLAPREPA